MSYAAAHKVIRGNLADWWEANYPHVPLAWDNDDTLPPKTGFWCKAYLLSGDARLAGLGGEPSARLWRVVGVLVVQVFTPLQQGVADAEELVTQLAKNFQGRTLNSVLFREVRFNKIGEGDAFIQHNISTSYQFDYHG